MAHGKLLHMKGNGKRRRDEEETPGKREYRLRPETKKSIWAIGFVGLAIILTLAGFEKAGPAGEMIYQGLEALVGIGYFILPLSAFLVAGVLLISERQRVVGVTALGAGLIIFAALGLIDIARPRSGGWLGLALGSLKIPFGNAAAVVLNIIILTIAALVTVNAPLRLPRFAFKNKDEGDAEPVVTGEGKTEKETKADEKEKRDKDGEGAEDEAPEISIALPTLLGGRGKKGPAPKFENYVAPPLDLLKSSVEKPTTGDLRANANIIKRTLEGFGIPVEMGEVNIGPKVTRYTLKPAEGMKLSRIVALHQDLALALAAHPIRIEAPIPGKSLVGIEVPNKAAAVVRLGSLMAYPEFHASGPLGFVLGRDVTGEPIFANLEKMPHLLIAGATGSGKSVAIHSMITSFLYKNSPAELKFVMIDPKRVELSIYQSIPHLVSAVVTENKKAVGVFRWAIGEMDRRYELLEAAGSRDITSYNKNGGKDDPIPFIVVVIDELADLMTSYGREVEGSIVRLAQMSRAVGIHLVLTTQRPSVEVITGLIKANVTGRVALQVASQIDSRTILDSAGAEKLLGGGDMLFQSAELSKPKRIQGAYISEEEINKVADFIREHNLGGSTASRGEAPVSFGEAKTEARDGDMFDDFSGSDDDELYDAAVQTVAEAQKASASLLQRRLRVGYARAARLLDLMEEKGIIGPGEGAKPRDVFLEKPPLE